MLTQAPSVHLGDGVADDGEALRLVVGDDHARGAQPLGLVGEEVAALGVGVVGNDEALGDGLVAAVEGLENLNRLG